MNTITAFLALAFPVLLVLPGCSASVSAYKNETPALALDQFFDGRLVAYGIVQNYSGKVTRRFRADIVASWNGNTGILDEQFRFIDGELQSRCWTIIKQGDRYRGTADDVVGEALGEVHGNTLNWRYRLQIDVNGKVWDVYLDDWLYLVDSDNLINRTKIKKYGLPVGELTLHIRKLKSDEVGNIAEYGTACSGEV